MAWYAKSTGAYAKEDAEAVNNAIEIYNTLGGRGWSINAVSAVLGNMEAESGYNPWRWEDDSVQSVDGSHYFSGGYGLPQFTPARKYIYNTNAQGYPGYAPNFSDQAGAATDGNAQILFIHYFADYYATDAFPESYEEFKASTQSIAYLTEAWCRNYERPQDPAATMALRITAAQYWYNILIDEPEPPQPPGPDPQPVDDVDIIMAAMLAKKRRRAKQTYRL